MKQGSEAGHGREGGLGPHQAQPSSPIITSMWAAQMDHEHATRAIKYEGDGM